MGKPGPAKTPTAIKIARGTVRKSAAKREPEPQTGPMRIPSWANFGKHGKTIWHDTLKRIPDGVAAASDIQMLVAYCKAWELFLTSEETLEQTGRYIVTGNNVTRLHPAVHDQDQARAEIRRLAALFGLSPADRASLQIQKPKSETVRKRERA